MTEWKVPLYRIFTDEEDVEAVNKVIRRGTQWAIGPEIEEFENAICDFVGTDYAVVVNSGTSGLHAALQAYGIGKNDEVIVPSFSFISTANSVLFVNAIPIFSDIEEENYGLDPSILERKITSKTKAIMPMDYAGQSCKIFDLIEIAKKYDLTLIEDAAEGLGSSINGINVGSVSDCAIFSFTGNKVMTTGEGGAVVTNSKEIYNKLKLIRSHGRVDTTNYFQNPNVSDYVNIGYNWRIPTISAALGISQLSKLPKIIKMRQDNAKYLSSHISKHKEIEIPSPKSGSDHIYQMYTIKLKNKMLRDNLHSFLTTKGIFSKIYFSPIHLTKFYKEKFGTKTGMLPVTEYLSEHLLTLPMFPNMTMEEKKLIVDSVDEFFELT
jgi:perosamine synthetase